jgi:hypothetical protein
LVSASLLQDFLSVCDGSGTGQENAFYWPADLLFFPESGDVGSGLPVAGFSCFAFASFSISAALGFGGGILASRSSSHFSLPSHSGSSAGGSGTISLISGTVGLA